jgi:hypothetical protein
MLYCLAVKGDSVNRPREVVEWRGLGRTQWAPEDRTALLLSGPVDSITFRDAPPLSRNSRLFNVSSSRSGLAGELLRTSLGSAVCRSRLDSPSFEEWQDLRWPSHDPARSRTDPASNAKE